MRSGGIVAAQVDGTYRRCFWLVRPVDEVNNLLMLCVRRWFYALTKQNKISIYSFIFRKRRQVDLASFFRHHPHAGAVPLVLHAAVSMCVYLLFTR